MNIFDFFSMLFDNILTLLSHQIPLGNDISISLLGCFIGFIVLGLLISVIRRLFS